ncbi:MAG: diaminopimelate epimerase [Acidimicrobiales bacterium]
MALIDGNQLALAKHEGAGNDFLVLVDLDRRVDLTPDLARALCDRHKGVGADGLLRVAAGEGGADLSMDLRNADGTEAAVSGNGLRCLGQAAVEAGLAPGPRFTVLTRAGVRTVIYREGDRPGRAMATVDMGPVRLGADQPQPMADRHVREVDLGNPHLVLYGPDHPSTVAVAEIGVGIEARRPDGVNVEFVALGPAPDELVLRVWERGVGETRACGSGSCAAAAAARSWGLVGERVRVHNPGGTLEVCLGPGELDPVLLGGPVHRVADVVVDLGALGLLE